MNAQSKHTPGPWKCSPYNRNDSLYAVYDANGDELTYDDDEHDANAHLIAAAPDMLAELKRDLQFAREMKGLIEALKGKKWVQHTMVLNRIERLTVAIARAEGR